MTRVLIAEDSPTQAQQLAIILETEGFDVVVSRNGEEGLTAAREGSFDMVISDIMMPKMTGYELCSALKADPLLKNIPVILLTSLTDPMDIVQGLEAGADNFITKPYDPEYLVRRVRTVLENKVVRAEERLRVGVEILFLGKKFMISSDREQILDLLLSTFEDTVRTNHQLREREKELARAKETLQAYAERLEGRVLASERRYQVLFDHAPDAIIVASQDGGIEMANRRAEDLFGYDLGTLLSMRMEDIIPDDMWPNWTSRSDLQGGEPFDERDIELAGAGGRVFPAEITFTRIESSDQEQWIAIFRDISERKRLEERIIQSQKMESLGQLASSVSHDFNNILMGMMTFISVLEKLFKDREDVLKHIRHLQTAADRGQWLTKQLLAFGRREKSEHRAVDLNEIIQSMEEMLKRILGSGIAIEKSLDPEIGSVEGDARRIELLILNLCINGRDAMNGRGVLRIETSRRGPSGPDDSTESVRLAVTDHGSGIPPEFRDKIFDPFFTTKPRGKGTGIGMFTVAEIVRELHAEMTFDTELGRGTTFIIDIPVNGQKKTGPQGEGEHVLLIEQQGSIRAFLKETLTSGGYEVSTRAGLEQSPEGEDRKPPSIVVMSRSRVDRSILDRLSASFPEAGYVLITEPSGPSIPEAGNLVQLRSPVRPQDLLEATGTLLARLRKESL